MSPTPGIFLSYAWGDDQPFVKRLYDDLKRRGLSPWMDFHDMPSRGRTLPQEVIDHLSECERVVAVMGPAAIRSVACQAEREYALSIGKAITPVLRQGDFVSLPPALAQLFVIDFRPSQDYAAAFEVLLRVIAESPAKAGALFAVPSLPGNYQPRETELRRIRGALLLRELKPVALLSATRNPALQGMPGVGKTVLAAACAHDYEARRAFPDGIIWLNVRRAPNLMNLVSLVGTALNLDLVSYPTVESAFALLQNKLQDLACLLILDDVWELQLAQEFLNVLGPRCRLMLTTRNRDLAERLGARVEHIDRLGDEAAQRLLLETAGLNASPVPAEASEVARHCGNLPFALAQCGYVIRSGNSWRDLLDALREADIGYLSGQLPNYEYLDIFKAIQVSVDFLSKIHPNAAQDYFALAAFPAAAIPEGAIVTLWTRDDRMSEREARKQLTLLHDVALVERLDGESPDRRASLHDLQIDYVRAAQQDPRAPHKDVLRAYGQKCGGDWSTGPDDGYFFQRIPEHLLGAGELANLRGLLFDARWLRAKLAISGVAALTADFDLASGDEDLRTVRRVIAQSGHVIQGDARQFASQVVGRLLLPSSTPTISKLGAQIAETEKRPWLCPLGAGLQTPVSPFVRALTGHTGPVRHLVLSKDGRRAVSASSDRTLRVWDIDEGNEPRALFRQNSEVRSLAISADGRRAASVSDDGTLSMWDLDSGSELTPLPLDHKVCAVSMNGDGLYVLLGHPDGTLSLYDLGGLQRWTSRNEFSDSVDEPLTHVTLSDDAQRALAVWEGNQVTLWRLPEVTPFLSKKRWELGALSPDGECAASYWDHHEDGKGCALQIWYLTIGHPFRRLKEDVLVQESSTGHQKMVKLDIWDVHAIAVSARAEQVVCVRDEFRLTYFDLRNFETHVRPLKGHTDEVNCVAISGDGLRVVSGSDDCTVRVWSPGDHQGSVLSSLHDCTLSQESTRQDRWSLIAGYSNGTVTLANAAVREALTGFRVRGWSRVISADGLRVVEGSSLWMTVTDVITGETVLRASGVPGFATNVDYPTVDEVAVSADGRRAASILTHTVYKSRYSYFVMWDLDQGVCLRRSNVWGDGRVDVSGDGRCVLTCDLSEGTGLRLWDLTSGEQLHEFKGWSRGFVGIAINYSGSRVVTLSHDGNLHLWDRDTGDEPVTLEARGKSLTAVALSPQGRWAATISSTGTRFSDHGVRIWDLDEHSLAATFTCDAPTVSVAFADDLTVVVQDQSRKLHVLALIAD